jgi:hypothetical protein
MTDSEDVRIFLSYDRADAELAREVGEALVRAGFRVWWDSAESRAGDDFVRAINEAL